jgi:uncharacterized protein YoxC
MAALVILSIIFIINLIKGSSNLKESKKLIDTMMLEVKESREIIKKQDTTIKELQKLNHELAIKVNKVDSANNSIKTNIERSLLKANQNINEIKNTISNIKTIEFH